MTTPQPHDAFKNLRSLIEHQAKSLPDSVAIGAPGRPSMTYRELLDQAETVGRTLSDGQVPDGSRVLVLVQGGPEMASCLLSVLSRYIAVPLNPALKEAEVSALIGILEPQAIVFDQRLLPSFPGILREDRARIALLVDDGPASKAGTFRLNLLAPASKAPPANPSQDKDVAIILQTSGSTSTPKFVPLSHENLLFAAFTHKEALDLKPSDRGFHVLPLFHVGGIVPGFLCAVAAGGSTFFPGTFDVQRFAGWLTELKPTWMTAVPSIYRGIVNLAQRAPGGVNHSFRFLRVGASPVDADLAGAIEKLFSVPLIQAYAMTETAGLIATNLLPPRVRKYQSGGVVVGDEVAIMDDNDKILTKESTGQIVVRGRNVMKGYWTPTGLDRSGFVDGWLKTGDIGFFDPDGHLNIVARKKEVIKRAGETLSPFEIEAALLKDNRIEDAVVFAVNDPTVGEEVNAAVVLREGFSNLSEEDIITTAARQISDYKAPKRIHFVTRIPRGPAGKASRNTIAASILGNSAPSDVPAVPLAPKSGAAPAEPGSSTSGDCSLEDISLALREIWSEVLNTKEFDDQANFFSLGGDSVLAAGVTQRVAEKFKIEISIVNVYTCPTIQKLGKFVKRSLQS